MPLGDLTYRLVSKVLERAAKEGRDPVEELDRNRLLLSPARRAEIEVKALSDLWRTLDAQNSSTIMSVFAGRNSGTPDDMYRALLDWLEAVIRSKEKGEEKT